ncbi:MAG: DUF4403 family protein [Xanthobacteraceae bacterium]
MAREASCPISGSKSGRAAPRHRRAAADRRQGGDAFGQADTRIVPNETKPDCPFPQQLDLVPQANQGHVDIAVPIDIPFTEVSRLLEAQFAGKTFPKDGSGSFAVTVKQASVAAAGDRLLISLLVRVKKNGFFSLGADATVYV